MNGTNVPEKPTNIPMPELTCLNCGHLDGYYGETAVCEIAGFPYPTIHDHCGEWERREAEK